MATTTTTQPASCECGCGGATVRPNARFVIGHDAKLKSRLIKAALRDPRKADSRDEATDWEAEASEATRELGRLGWSAHLTLSRDAAKRKAARKAASAKAKAKQGSGRKPAAPAPKPVPTTERAAGADGRVPASVGRLAHAS